MLNDQTYNWVNNSINLSLLIAIALIVRQIWRYKNLDKKTKTNWTILSVFAGTILAIVYPWLIDKKLQEKNKKSA